MPRFEYKVVPAPSKGQKAKGVKSNEDRFALAVETALNQLAAEGWQYVRAELLPSDERSGLTGSAVHWRNVLVFRRRVETEADKLHARPIDPVTLSDLDGDRDGSVPPVAAPLSHDGDVNTPHLSLVRDEAARADLDEYDEYEEYDGDDWDDWEEEVELVQDPPEDDSRR